MTRTTRSTALKAAVPASKGTGEDPATQLSSPPATPLPTRKLATKSKASSAIKLETQATPVSKGRKRGSKQVKQEDDGDVNDLPHNLGTALPSPSDDDADAHEYESPKKRGRKSAKREPQADVKMKIEDESKTKADTPKKSSKAKKAGYGLTPGLSPYPDYMRPTPEECAEVVRLS